MSHINTKIPCISAISLIFALLTASCGAFYSDILKKKKIIIPHSLDSSSDSKDIISFSFEALLNKMLFSDSIATIKGNSITVTVPHDTILTDLIATFTTTGKFVSVNGNKQVSGITNNNHTDNVTYTVTAIDGTTKDYMVKVLLGQPMEAQLARTATGESRSKFFGISTASDGSVYAAGFIFDTGTFDFGNGVTAAGTSVASNIVLVKYKNSGTAQWAKTVTGGTYSGFYSVSAASDGSVYAAGCISGTDTYDFGNGVTAEGTSSNSNIVLVKYNSSGTAQWAKTVTGGGGPSNSYSNFLGVSVASDGHVYAAGEIEGTDTFDFGNGVTVASTAGKISMLLVKYDNFGTAEWAKMVTNESYPSSSLSCVSAASDGYVYVAGEIGGTGTYNFDNGVTAAGNSISYNIVLVKYNGSGTAQWAKTATGPIHSYSYFSGVSAALDGSIYAVGSIFDTGTYDFGNGVTAAGAFSGGNIVLVKYNNSGMAQWAKTVTGGSYSSLHAVSAASDGSIYTAGEIFGSGIYQFGNEVTAAVTSSGGNTVLVKYNSFGTVLWAKAVIGISSSRFQGVSAASDGSVYAGGEIGPDDYEFGNRVTAAGTFGGGNLVLVKYK